MSAMLVLAATALYFFQRFHVTADKVVFRPQSQDQAVVPFQLKDYLISLYADFDGRKEECILDTGSPLILWPRNANLSGTRTLSWGYGGDAAGNRVSLTEYVLGSIKIGGYELQGVPTVAVSGNLNPAHTYPDLRQVCDLGNTAFSEAVLTIDYKKRVLILRNRQYDPMLHCSKRGFVLPFHWASKVPRMSNFGYLVVPAETSGHPLEVVVDTGDGSSTTALTNAYYKSHLSGTKLSHNWIQKTAFGRTKADWIPKLKISVPDARLQSPPLEINQPAVIMPDQHDGADAVIGYTVLKDYLVTIDYPRQRIFLEPN